MERWVVPDWKFGTVVSRQIYDGGSILVMAIAENTVGPAFDVQELGMDVALGQWAGFTLADPDDEGNDEFYPVAKTCYLENGGRSIVVEK